MSVRTVLQRTEPPLEWLDVVSPTAEELDAIARAHGLHALAVKDCLDPEHLPKFEPFDGYNFIIIRAFDEQSEPTCGTVQELTRKIAIFSAPAFLITIHRTEQHWLTTLEARIETENGARAGKEGLATYLLTQVLNGAVDTYLKPMEAIQALDLHLLGPGHPIPALQLHIAPSPLHLTRRADHRFHLLRRGEEIVNQGSRLPGLQRRRRVRPRQLHHEPRALRHEPLGVVREPRLTGLLRRGREARCILGMP